MVEHKYIHAHTHIYTLCKCVCVYVYTYIYVYICCYSPKQEVCIINLNRRVHIQYVYTIQLYFLLCCLLAQSCPTLLWPRGLWPTRFLCPWDFPAKNIGMGCHFLLQGIFPTQGSNPCLLLGRRILYQWATWEALIFIKHQQLNTVLEIVIIAVPGWHIQLPASVYLYVLLTSED